MSTALIANLEKLIGTARDCALLRGRVQRLLRLDDPLRITEQLLKINAV